ncbi:DUF2061 domain-containing protein [Pseudooceanicola sp. MF1-13]|uniref:DUF2061 domain-containing protein n=1 Tax=Pseudooceanicola sp. MF1-13 TaxID=3379095 RepID=UPI003892B350
MESKIRLLLKSATWQAAGIVTMTVIGYVFTGSVAAGSGIAVAGAVTGFVAYFVHELAWSKVSWGLRR